MTPTSGFRVGSITKTFVAALVLSLVETGSFEADHPVERWLPGVFPAEARSRCATCSTNAGLPDMLRAARIEGDRHRRWQPTELVELALARGGTSRADGRFAYASTNYVLLGMIAEAAGGQSLERLLASRLPRAARAVTDELSVGIVRGSHVHGHRAPSHQGVVTGQAVDIGDEPAWWTWAAGGVVSTAADVQRFFAAVLRGELLGPVDARDGDARPCGTTALRPRPRGVPDPVRAGVGPHGERPGNGRGRLEHPRCIAPGGARRQQLPAVGRARRGGT